MKKNIAFQLLNLVNNTDVCTLNQTYSFKELSLKNSQEIHSPKRELEKITLLGLFYEIQLNESLEESFLIFAPPLEHLLSLHIFLQKNTFFLRIEYENKMFLILKDQIQYLQKPYTILEEIESELLGGFSYKKTFKSPFNCVLPQTNQDTLFKVNLIEEKSNILFSPHINTSQIHFLEHFGDLYLCDTMNIKNYYELIQKYIHFHPSSKTTHFLGSEIIHTLHVEYVVSKSKNNALICLNVATSYVLNLHSNYSQNIINSISAESSNTSLPIYLNSIHEFVQIQTEDDFLKITGIPFSYDSSVLENILIKDRFSKESVFCMFEISKDIVDELNSIAISNDSLLSYSNPKEYFIKKTLQKHVKEDIFIPEKVNEELVLQSVQDLSEFLQNLIISHTSFPNFEEKSYLSNGLFSYCFRLNEYIQYSKPEFKEFILYQIQLIITEISKISFNISYSKKELFELSYILKQMIILIQNCEIKFDFNLDFFNELDIFSKKEFNFEMVFSYYDEKYCENALKNINQIITVLPFIKRISTFYETSNEYLDNFLREYSTNVDETHSKKHTKMLISNEELFLFYY